MQSSRTAVALTASVLALSPCTLAQGSPSAPEPAAAQQPTSASSIWLQAGAVWTYQVTQSNPAKPKGIDAGLLTVTAESTAHMPDGSQLHQLRVGRGEQGITTYEVWSITDGRVLQHASKSMLRRGTLDLEASPMEIRRRAKSAAANKPHRWQWQGPLLGADLGSGNRAGEPSVGVWHHQAESLGDESIVVPAGTFTAEHIRIRSEQRGKEPFLRDVWLAPGVGVVCEERRCGKSQRMQRLKEFTSGRGRGAERFIAHLEGQLKKGRGKAFNNTPRVTWLEAGPEALLVAGRIAAVHTDGWNANYLVTRDSMVAFDLTGSIGLGRVAYAALDAKTVVPSLQLDLHGLALLLARSEAALHQFGNVRPVPVTLEPSRTLRKADREASAQITGGALDGSQRNIAIRLSFARLWQYDLATDIPVPVTQAEQVETGRGR